MKSLIAPFLIFLGASACLAQTTSFTYQGHLTDMNNPPTGIYQMEFKLFDALSEGNKIGPTIPNNVSVAHGVFSVTLDFGATVFTGQNRFLEIAVRKNANENFTVLTPRQQISSSPYSIRTLSAAQADLAMDANKLGGVAAGEYVTTSTVGSAFIRNDLAEQQTADFNISGAGVLGGNLTANTITSQTGTNVYGFRQTDGTTVLSTYIGGSASGAEGGWFGTESDSPLHFFTNNGQSSLTILQNGNVGIGTFNPSAKLHLTGNAVQDRSSSGVVKAMLSVAADGTITRCYNGVTGSSSGGCGFTVSAGSSGTYRINIGFQLTDRFLSVSARGFTSVIIGIPPTMMSADFRFNPLPNANPNEVFVDTFQAENGATTNAPFMLIVY